MDFPSVINFFFLAVSDPSVIGSVGEPCRRSTHARWSVAKCGRRKCVANIRRKFNHLRNILGQPFTDGFLTDPPITDGFLTNFSVGNKPLFCSDRMSHHYISNDLVFVNVTYILLIFLKDWNFFCSDHVIQIQPKKAYKRRLFFLESFLD